MVAAPPAHLRPFVALEPGRRTPMLIEGILDTWRGLDEGRRCPWWERSLPAAFRRELAWVPGLQDYAGERAADVPPARRSSAWRRLLSWKARYRTLELERRIQLLKLLGMLGFYRDNEDLLRDEPAPGRGRLDERATRLAYLRANNRVLLDEPAMKADYSEMLGVARRGAPGTPIRFLVAIKATTLFAEHGQRHAGLREAERLARETLEALRARSSPSELAAFQSRYWRTASYLPFLEGDYEEVARRQERADELALRAIETGTREEARVARDIRYAVLATRTSTFLRLGRPEGALAPLAEMTTLDPLGAWQRLWRGMALFELGRVEEACAAFLDAFRLAPPGKAKACAGAARCFSRLGRPKDAADWSELARRMGAA